MKLLLDDFAKRKAKEFKRKEKKRKRRDAKDSGSDTESVGSDSDSKEESEEKKPKRSKLSKKIERMSEEERVKFFTQSLVMKESALSEMANTLYEMANSPIGDVKASLTNRQIFGIFIKEIKLYQDFVVHKIGTREDFEFQWASNLMELGIGLSHGYSEFLSLGANLLASTKAQKIIKSLNLIEKKKDSKVEGGKGRGSGSGVKTCFKCGSTTHLAACHKREDSDANKEKEEKKGKK